MDENNAGKPCETLLDYAMAIAHERELDVTGQKHDSDGAVRRFKAAVVRALLSKLRAEGVQAGDAMQWPTMPPSKGQSSVLFDDGYAEGWAKCLDECRRAALASAPVAGDAQHDTDSVCAWQVWWNQHKNRYTTTRQASLAAFAAGKEWRDAAPQASEAVRNAALEEAANRVDGPLDANRWAAATIRALKTQADKDGQKQGADDAAPEK